MIQCLICKRDNIQSHNIGVGLAFTCPRCGLFTVMPFGDTERLRLYLDTPSAQSSLKRSNLSHLVRRQQNGHSIVNIPFDKLETWSLTDPPPSPNEQFDSLIEWLGDKQDSCTESVVLHGTMTDEIDAWVGARITSPSGAILGWMLQQAGANDLVERKMEALRLTMKGWQRHGELKRTATNKKIAFMAMKFGDEQLNDVLTSCFKPGAKAAGFDLRLLTDGQPAGLIDDHLRVALRQARFVVADLTYGNRGAYWEAGFAEGQNKPVIYTCRKDVWSDKANSESKHFDTNHLNTIIWEPENLDSARDRLTAMIRATLPSESKLD
jgi:hypothetical protein